MIEKPKREKTKNDARSTQTAIALVAALLVMGAGAFLFLKPATGTVVSDAEAMQAEFEVAVTVGPSYPSGCNMMWQYGEDDALTAQLQSALDEAGITYEEAVMTTYGEQETCQSEDGSYYDGNYLIMDYSPRITIEAAADELGRGQQIMALVQPAAATLILEGKTLGYLDVIFNLSDGEQEQWKARLGDVQNAIEDDADAAAIYSMGQ